MPAVPVPAASVPRSAAPPSRAAPPAACFAFAVSSLPRELELLARQHDCLLGHGLDHLVERALDCFVRPRCRHERGVPASTRPQARGTLVRPSWTDSLCVAITAPGAKDPLAVAAHEVPAIRSYLIAAGPAVHKIAPAVPCVDLVAAVAAIHAVPVAAGVDLVVIIAAANPIAVISAADVIVILATVEVVATSLASNLVVALVAVHLVVAVLAGDAVVVGLVLRRLVLALALALVLALVLVGYVVVLRTLAVAVELVVALVPIDPIRASEPTNAIVAVQRPDEVSALSANEVVVVPRSDDDVRERRSGAGENDRLRLRASCPSSVS